MLSFGNRKLPTTMGIFNLPAVKTCPGSTPECRKWCYARKAERIYPQVLPFRENNFKMSLLDSFETDIEAELARKRKVNTVRIHESGDFYNQKYLDKWLSIARKHPELTFFAYTKNQRLDFSKRPKNFILLLSDDNKEFKKEWHFFDGVASVSEEHVDKVKGGFVCPYPVKSCKDCNYCYSNKKEFKHVVFNKH